MNKILAVIKKDIVLQIRNYKELLFTIGFVIVFMLIFSFTNDNSLIIGVESSLKEDINFNKQEKGIIINCMNQKIVVKTEFYEKEKLEESLKNNKYPLIIYKNHDKLTLKLNTRDPKYITTYLILSRYFNGVKEDNFNIEHVSSGNNTIIMMIISMAFIFGGASKGSSILFQEKNNGTLNILYKSGLSSFAIVLSKLLFTVLVMIFTLLCVGMFGYFTDTVNLFSCLKNILYLIFIMIPISIMGNFIGIVSKTVEENRSLEMILFMPAVLYFAIVSSIPSSYQFLLRLHPGIAVIHFYEKILENQFDLFLFLVICIITCVMFAVNVFILRKNAEKSL